MIEIKSKREIELMREAGKILAEMHERVGEKIAPGISTGELDEFAEKTMRKLGGFPSMKGRCSLRPTTAPSCRPWQQRGCKSKTVK